MPPHQQGEGGSQAQDQTTAAGDRSVAPQARAGGGPGKGCLAVTRWSYGGWVRCALPMPEDLPDHPALLQDVVGPDDGRVVATAESLLLAGRLTWCGQANTCQGSSR